MDRLPDIQRIVQSQTPEELFGALTGAADAQLAAVGRQYRELARRCHPDLFPGDPMAAMAFKALADLFGKAEERIRQGVYGTPYRTASRTTVGVIRTGRREYRIVAALAEGSVADVYLGEYEEGDGQVRQAAIKIARDPKDNPLMANEQALLKKLAHVSLPVLVECFQTKAGQAGSVLRFVEGLDGYAVRELAPHKDGIKPRLHIGWILERQLSVLGYLHSQLVVHGNIEPGHLVVVPENHNVVLLDFCFAAANPGKKSHIRIMHEDFSAPETAKRAPARPAADLYALGKSAIYLLGGDPARGVLPSDLDERYARFIEALINPDPDERVDDAWQAAHALLAVREAVDGKRRFVPFPV